MINITNINIWYLIFSIFVHDVTFFIRVDISYTHTYVGINSPILTACLGHETRCLSSLPETKNILYIYWMSSFMWIHTKAQHFQLSLSNICYFRIYMYIYIEDINLWRRLHHHAMWEKILLILESLITTHNSCHTLYRLHHAEKAK